MTDSGALGDGFGVAGALTLLPALVACGIVPGWAAAGALGLREPFARIGLAVLLSALVTFACGVVSLLVTRGVGAAATLLTVVAAGLVARALFARRGRPVPPRLVPSWSAGLVAAWTLLVIGVYAANPELRFRVDGWFHGAVAARLLAVGLPPDDPYFAGLTLHYPWAWHVVLATTAQAGARFGVSAFDAMAGWSALAALSLGAWLVVLGRAWAGVAGLGAAAADRAGAAAVGLAVVGTNPLGGAIWLGRGLLGHEGGAVELARSLSAGATDAMLSTTWRLPHVSLASPVDKFLTPTAFGLAEASLLAFGALALFIPAAAGWRRFALLAAVALAALVFHAASGPAVLVVALAAALVAGARGRAALGAWAVAAAVAAPYLALTLGSWTDGRAAAAPRADMALAIVTVGGLILALAGREASRLPRVAAPARAWLVAALVFLALAAGVAMIQRNETKFLNLALLALAAPAAVAFVRLRPAACAALLALTVPAHAIAVTGFVLDRGQDTPGRRVPAPALRAAYAWIGEHTRPGDVFLEAVPPGAREPDRDLLVHGPRALLWGGPGYASNWGYPGAELGYRKAAAEKLAVGPLDSDAVFDLVGKLPRSRPTLYAVRRGVHPAAIRLPGGGRWTRVFVNEAVALDRLDVTARPDDMPHEGAPQ